MTFNKTLGAIVLAGAIGLSGCSSKNEGVDSPEKIGRVGDAQVIYGTTTWKDSDGLFDQDKKMVVKYDNGLTLRIYDGDNDGKIDRVIVTYDKAKAQEIYDSLKTQLDEQ